MNRPLWKRSVAGILAIWIAFVLSAPEIAHACPMHAAVPAGVDGGAHAAHAAHAAHTGSAHGAEDGADSSKGTDPGACTCPGACTSQSRTVTPAREAAAVPGAALRIVERAPMDAVAALPRGASQRLLPFPNGPPRA